MIYEISHVIRVISPISPQLRLIEDISQHLTESYLPSVYGGSRKFSHSDWVMQCIECYKRSIEDNPPPPPRPPPLTGTLASISVNIEHRETFYRVRCAKIRESLIGLDVSCAKIRESFIITIQ